MNVFFWMGIFYIICNVLFILGKWFGEGGLKDICIEVELVVEGFINGVFDGKYYNWVVRVYKYIYEVLMRLVWVGFINWVEENVFEKSVMIKLFLEEVNRMVGELS